MFSALALRCHLCLTDLSEVIPIAEQSNSTGLSSCASPNQSLNCSQRLDPFFGTKMDSCVIGKLTLNTSLPIGDIEIYYLNCATMSKCSMLKNQTCPRLESELGGTPKFDLKSCDFTCCQGDLCNAPSISPSSPAASTAEYPVGTGTTAKSLVKSSVPPASARFGVLILMALTAVNF